MAREKKKVHKVEMTEGKRNIIRGQILAIAVMEVWRLQYRRIAKRRFNHECQKAPKGPITNANSVSDCLFSVSVMSL